MTAARGQRPQATAGAEASTAAGQPGPGTSPPNTDPDPHSVERTGTDAGAKAGRGDLEAEPTAESLLETVRGFRRAARRIVRSTRPREERLLDLIRLGVRARRSPLPDWCQAIVWLEAAAFIRGEPEFDPVQVGNPREDAIRRQHAKGHVRCETCLQRLPTDEELDRTRHDRREELERRRLLERAGE